MAIEHINKTDTLNEGREKLNAAIDGANAADVTSKEADTKATQALANSESTQTQLDTIVIDGDSSVEAAQARVDEKGEPHPTLKARIDDGMNSVNQQLAEKAPQEDVDQIDLDLTETIEQTNRLDNDFARFGEKISDSLPIVGGDLGTLNAINSWWVYPLATHRDGNTYVGYTDNKGGVWILRNKLNKTEKYRVISNEIDDHNAPAIAILPDNRIAVFYSRHNIDHFLRYRVSATPFELDFGYEQTINLGGNVTYAQICISREELYVFTRVGSSTWRILVADGELSGFHTNKEFVNFGTGNQGYLKIKRNPETDLIRIAFGGHPTIGNIHDIFYCYLQTNRGNYRRVESERPVDGK